MLGRHRCDEACPPYARRDRLIEDDKHFGSEDLERLAQRGARYRKGSAQLPFGNSRTRRDFAFRQDVPEAGNHLVVHHIEISLRLRNGTILNAKLIWTKQIRTEY